MYINSHISKYYCRSFAVLVGSLAAFISWMAYFDSCVSRG